jgi:hypothetical protein
LCSCLKLAFMARPLAPATLSAHLRASCRRCSARVVITGRTLLAVGHRERTPARCSPRPGVTQKPLLGCARPPAAARTHKGIPVAGLSHDISAISQSRRQEPRADCYSGQLGFLFAIRVTRSGRLLVTTAFVRRGD